MLSRNLFAITLALFVPSIGQAQGPVYRATFGLSTDAGFLPTKFSEGLTGTLGSGQFFAFDLVWAPADAPIALQAGVAYNRLASDRFVSVSSGAEGGRMAQLDQAWGIGLSGVWPAGNVVAGGLYLSGGATFQVSRLSVGEGGTRPAATNWGQGLGVSVGAGFGLEVAGVLTGLEIRANQGLYGERGSGWMSVLVPIRLPF